jgi:hypothetical protein
VPGQRLFANGQCHPCHNILRSVVILCWHRIGQSNFQSQHVKMDVMSRFPQLAHIRIPVRSVIRPGSTSVIMFVRQTGRVAVIVIVMP